MTRGLAILSMIAVGWALSAWLLMLAVSRVHEDWLPVVPPLGYVTSLLLTVLLGTRTLISLCVAQACRDALDGKQP